jgi:hypothetical protein
MRYSIRKTECAAIGNSWIRAKYLAQPNGINGIKREENNQREESEEREERERERE